MKAIPLIACLALVAVQGRAQDSPPPGTTILAQTAAAPSLADRVKLLNEIKDFRHALQSPPPGLDPKLNDLEREAGDTDDLGKTRKKFQDLKDGLQPASQKAAAQGMKNDSSLDQPKIQAIAENSVRSLAGVHEAEHFYDGSAPAKSETADGPGGAVRAAAGGKDASSLINAPASIRDLRISPVPSPADPPPPPVLTPEDLPPWVDRNGISPIDYSDLVAPPPAAPEQTALPPSNKPASLAAIANWIDHSGVSDEIIANLKKIEVVGSDLLSGFGGYCYWGVKWMLTMALPGYNQPKDLDLPDGDAYKMLLALKKDPKLMEKLHLFPLDLKSVPSDQAYTLPERTLLIWDRGCAGFSDKSGHIEFTLHADKMSQLAAKAFYPLSRKYGFWVPNLEEKTQVLACSDGCEVHYMSKLRSYSGKCLSAYVPVAEHPAGS